MKMCGLVYKTAAMLVGMTIPVLTAVGVADATTVGDTSMTANSFLVPGANSHGNGSSGDGSGLGTFSRTAGHSGNTVSHSPGGAAQISRSGTGGGHGGPG